MVYRLTIILYLRELVGHFLSMYGPTRTFVQFIKSYKIEYNGDIHYRDQYYTNKGVYYVTQNNNHTVISFNNQLKAICKDTDSTGHSKLT